LIQLTLIIPFVLLCAFRSIFEPSVIQSYLIFVFLIYVFSTVVCIPLKPIKKTPWRNGIISTLFAAICLSGLTAGFITKDKWLGVHIYFVPSMSMYPTLKPGEFILVDTWQYQTSQPEERDVVVFQHPQQQWLVKRIGLWPENELNKKDQFYLLGDNTNASQDSRHFGGIEKDHIIGKVKLVLLGINQHHQLQSDSYLRKVN
jgi:signal peptidase I